MSIEAIAGAELPWGTERRNDLLRRSRMPKLLRKFYGLDSDIAHFQVTPSDKEAEIDTYANDQLQQQTSQLLDVIDRTGAQIEEDSSFCVIRAYYEGRSVKSALILLDQTEGVTIPVTASISDQFYVMSRGVEVCLEIVTDQAGHILGEALYSPEFAEQDMDQRHQHAYLSYSTSRFSPKERYVEISILEGSGEDEGYQVSQDFARPEKKWLEMSHRVEGHLRDGGNFTVEYRKYSRDLMIKWQELRRDGWSLRQECLFNIEEGQPVHDYFFVDDFAAQIGPEWFGQFRHDSFAYNAGLQLDLDYQGQIRAIKVVDELGRNLPGEDVIDRIVIDTEKWEDGVRKVVIASLPQANEADEDCVVFYLGEENNLLECEYANEDDMAWVPAPLNGSPTVVEVGPGFSRN